MRENRRTYRIANLTLQELNFILAQIADRLDQIEGYRGTPEFQTSPDMNGNRVTNVGTPTSSGDAATYGDVSDLDGSVTALQAQASLYVVKAGESGGQTIYGGTGSTDDLILLSTSHADKGYVGYADSNGTFLHGWQG